MGNLKNTSRYIRSLQIDYKTIPYDSSNAWKFQTLIITPKSGKSCSLKGKEMKKKKESTL